MTLTTRLARLEERTAPQGERFGDLSDSALDHALATEVERMAGSVPAGTAGTDGTARLQDALDLVGIPRTVNGRVATLTWRLDQLLEGNRR